MNNLRNCECHLGRAVRLTDHPDSIADSNEVQNVVHSQQSTSYQQSVEESGVFLHVDLEVACTKVADAWVGLSLEKEQAVKDHEVENKYHINYPQEGHHPLAVPLLSIIELKDCRGILGKLRVLDQSCTSEPVNQHSCQEKGGLKL